MKKFLLTLMLLGAVSAVAATKSAKAQYPDGTYRGVYISSQETQVELQFDLKNDVITKINYRTLQYKGHDWLNEDEYKAKNGGYMKLLERITNKKVQDVMPTMYNSEEIEKGGATVREMKVRSALQYGLNLGPFKLPKKEAIYKYLDLEELKMAKKKIVIGVIGSDCHTVGNKIIHSKLEENGFDVINIGALSPQIDFINAALESNSDAIIVSSIYGYGELDCQGIREKCDEYGLKNILLYIGGNIGSSSEEWEKTEKRFKEMGFDRIYKPGTPIEETIIDLKKDFQL